MSNTMNNQSTGETKTSSPATPRPTPVKKKIKKLKISKKADG